MLRAPINSVSTGCSTTRSRGKSHPSTGDDSMASTVQTYFNFAGNAEEALNFYAEVFNSKVEGIMRWGDMPGSEDNDQLTDADKKLIMNSQVFILGGHSLMIADVLDSFPEEHNPGNNITMVLSPETRTEADSLFAVLSEGGEVRMPLEEAFWGDYFGEVTDKFGIRWMFATPAKS